MATSIISISLDSSEESVGTSIARVILFRTIPTTVLATAPTVDLPVIHDDTPLISTDTPTISPIVPTIPPIAPTIYRVAARSSPPSPPIRQILPAPHGLHRRSTILVLLGQLIPVGQPYRTQPNKVLQMLTARKRVGPLPNHRLALRYSTDYLSSNHFTSDDSSRDSQLDSSSDSHSDSSSYSSLRHSSLGYVISDSLCDSPTATSVGYLARDVGPLLHRLEDVDGLEGTERGISSSTLDVVFRCVSYFGGVTRADLLPPPKRIRDSDLVTDFEPDIDPDVQADIDDCFAYANAIRARETDVRVVVETVAEEEAESSKRGTVEVEVDPRIEPVIDDDLRVSVREDVPDHVTTDGVVEMTTLVEHIIVARAENRPPMLEKSMYDSWESRIRLFIKGKKHGRMMLDSIDNGSLVYPTVEENGQTRPKKYSKLTEAQQLQDDCDAAKDIWDRVKMLMKGTELSYQERECRLYNLFDKFAHVLVQVNTKFLNALPSEWSKFVTDVKLAKSLYTTKYDQLYAYLSQHERHANEVRITYERYLDPLAFVANSPTLYNPSQSPQHSGEDPIECINKAIAFLSAVASRFPLSNNQLRTSSNPRNQATIQDGRVTPKKPRNAAWFKEKLMLAEAQEAVQILDEEKLAFLVDPDCDDLSLAKVVLMANLSSCDPEVLSEAPYSDSYPNDMINQDVQEIQYSEQTHVDDCEDNEIHSGSNIIPYSQYLQESQDAVIQDTNPSTPNDLLVLSLVKQMTDYVAHLDKEN
ncbi:hypothetical protein Tco_0926140 [Tanacetum coccineum]|uniref:Uncharacterized protein n=1 Tax=Tanacetum coccineum TaxID=301880 RepID=A0ABQ5D8X4_9ASTR